MLIKKLFNITITLLALLSCQSYSAEQNFPVIMTSPQMGDLPKGTLPRVGNWIALECENLNCSIKPILITISSGKSKNVLDEYEATDKIEVVNSSSKKFERIAMIHGLDIPAGDIKTAYRLTNLNYMNSHATSALNKLGIWQIKTGNQTITISRVLTQEYQYRYFLSDSSQKHFLFRHPKNCSNNADCYIQPIIYWVGDIDKDDKLDFIIALDDSCNYDQKLYLSSKAKPNQLVGLAAELSGSFAACGC